jgi:hypothetical protein
MSTGEQNTKIAIVVDGALPAGLAANTAAVLAMSLGRRLVELIGADLKDGDGSVHPGITNTPIPILTAPADRVKDIRARATSDDDLFLRRLRRPAARRHQRVARLPRGRAVRTPKAGAAADRQPAPTPVAKPPGRAPNSRRSYARPG